MKHTKGPWENVGNMVVAKLQTVDGAFIYPTMAVLSNTTTSMRANASLITAAPEMFEALERQVIWLEDMSSLIKSDTFHSEVNTEVENIKKIIKKAKGE